jgi:hypothetical protein
MGLVEFNSTGRLLEQQQLGFFSFFSSFLFCSRSAAAFL